MRRPRTAREPFLTLACSCSCLGVLSTQAYTYFKRYPLDKPFYKALVRAAKPVAYPARTLANRSRSATCRSSVSGALREAVVDSYGR